ncbi:MAG: hypothetical protein ACTHMM_24580 [Agriterribacter sp.]
MQAAKVELSPEEKTVDVLGDTPSSKCVSSVAVIKYLDKYYSTIFVD